MRANGSTAIVVAGLTLVATLAAAQSAPAVPSGLDRFMPPAPHGPDHADLIALGRRLFFDPILSIDSSHACASCHQPAKAFADGRATSRGVLGRQGTRNVPAIVNRGWGRAFFWDGRITLLETQVLKPISEPSEMGFSADEAVRRIVRHSTWRGEFTATFGDEPNVERLARALAAYVRSIQSGDSPFDRAMLGEAQALSEQQQRGLQIFQGRARCIRCHSGALLTDEAFHNTGVAWRNGPPTDSGRAFVTRRGEDVGSFKTPTLRQIGRSAPYMHDGSLGTLEEVVEFYNRGGHGNPNRDPDLKPLDLSPDEKAALLAFLRALDGDVMEGGRRADPRQGGREEVHTQSQPSHHIRSTLREPEEAGQHASWS